MAVVLLPSRLASKSVAQHLEIEIVCGGPNAGERDQAWGDRQEERLFVRGLSEEKGSPVSRYLFSAAVLPLLERS